MEPPAFSHGYAEKGDDADAGKQEAVRLKDHEVRRGCDELWKFVASNMDRNPSFSLVTLRLSVMVDPANEERSA